MPRPGKRQIETLAAIATPSRILLNASRSDLRLIEYGLAQRVHADNGLCITPAGLRFLADEMEAGRVKHALTLAAERRAAAH